MSELRRIGGICNYYGDLKVKEEYSKFYWGIEDYSNHDWEEIPEYLFIALNRFQDSIDKKEKK